MQKKSRGLLGYIIFLLPIVVLVILLSGIGKEKMTDLSYEDLIRYVSDGKVQKVTVQGSTLYTRLRGVNDTYVTTGSPSLFVEDVTKEIAKKQSKAPSFVSTKDWGFELVQKEERTNTFLTTWLPMLLPVVLIILFFMFMTRQQNKSANMAMNFGKSRATMADPSRNTTTFADVAGAKEEKEDLAEIVDFLKNPRKYLELGARIPKGVLMVGPPGTGKTLLAKAVAGEAKVPFFSISGSDFVEMFVGMGASRVRDLFDQAKRHAPAIVFIDEIDAVGRHRGAGLGGGHDEREQTLNQLLVEMDGFTANEGVVVLAATNRRDILDPALLRPGRFDRQITVNYPDLEGRVEILKVHSRKKPLESDVDIENIAKRTPFATGADLENIMNEAALQAARENRTTISAQNVVEAVERVQMGPEKRSHKVLEEDRIITAYHEAGHAIVGHYLDKCDDIHLITVVPRGPAAGFTLALPEKELDHNGKEELLQRVAMMLGGRAAESLTQKDVCTGAVSDLKRATEIVRSMVTEYGMSEELGPVYLGGGQEVFVGMEMGKSRDYSESTASLIDSEVRTMLEKCYRTAEDVLKEHREELDRLAHLLIEKETVDREAFLACLNGKNGGNTDATVNTDNTELNENDKGTEV